LQLTLPPKTQGQRPPPFDGPPTAVSCGGEEFGDPAFYLRSLNRYMDTLSKASAISEWSIEVLGVQEELAQRFRVLTSDSQHFDQSATYGLSFGFDVANRHLEKLEEHFFAQYAKTHHISPLQFDAGWIGPHDPTTLITLDEVRCGLLDICAEIRTRMDFPAEQNAEFADDAVARIEDLINMLFRITGPDEFTWLLLIGELSEAARILKRRALRTCSG